MNSPFESPAARSRITCSSGRRGPSLRLTLGTVAAALALVLCAAPSARAQLVGTGGVSGTGSLTSTDFFVGAQKVQGVNLNDRDRANFLNQASCFCQKPVWIRALLQPSATLKAAAVPATATVSLYVGNGCDNSTLIGACLPLQKGVAFSLFKKDGIQVQTSVNALAREYSSLRPWNGASAQGDTRTDSCFANTANLCGAGTGGTSGTGGAIGTGGATGSGGDTGAGGAGGTTAASGGASGTGGSTGTGGATGSGNGSSSQTIWLFVSTTGEGYHDVVSVATQWVLDITPPCPPTNLVLEQANEALIEKWTAVDATLSGNDLSGYQLMCSRGRIDEQGLQVFKTGTYTPAFDDRCSAGSSPFDRVDPTFVCSDIIPKDATSARLKLLENDITYAVGVIAFDSHRNASLVTPAYQRPVKTMDFYEQYRDGYPQGQAQGGFCSVEPPTGERWSRGALASLLGSLLVGGVVLGRRRAVARRRRP